MSTACRAEGKCQRQEPLQAIHQAISSGHGSREALGSSIPQPFIADLVAGKLICDEMDNIGYSMLTF